MDINRDNNGGDGSGGGGAGGDPVNPDTLSEALELLDTVEDRHDRCLRALAAIIFRVGQSHPTRAGDKILRVPNWAFRDLPRTFNVFFQNEGDQVLLTLSPHPWPHIPLQDGPEAKQ